MAVGYLDHVTTNLTSVLGRRSSSSSRRRTNQNTTSSPLPGKSTFPRILAISGGCRELIEGGIVRAVTPKEVSSALSMEGFRMLDIRPEWEREKARVPDSAHVPLFVEDTDMGVVTLLKKWVHFGYIGLWTGQRFTAINEEFLAEVEREVPDKDAKLLVACGEGLRSMVAIKRLHEGGYKKLGWLAGGFNRATEEDFPSVEGPSKLQYATIGGVSYYLLQLLFIFRAIPTPPQQDTK